MPQRPRFFNDLVTLPWKANLILAAVAYVAIWFGLGSIVGQGPVSQGVAVFTQTLAVVFASVFVLAAIISALLARHKIELLDKQTTINSVRNLSWKDFEFLVGEAYRRKGFHVQDNTGSGPDGGIDLTLKRDGEKYLVQCKNWRTKAVGVPVVRELFGVVTAEKAAGGIIACSSTFTRDAIAFARGKPIELIGGAELVRLISDVQPRPATQLKVKTVSTAPELSADSSCPTCSSPMVIRTARRGKNAGSSFWGCSRFPKCRGTRQLDA